MESINVGFLSVLPPIIAIGLALVTKEVISSLIIGILSGTFIYACHFAREPPAFVITTTSAPNIARKRTIAVFPANLSAMSAIVVSNVLTTTPNPLAKWQA